MWYNGDAMRVYLDTCCLSRLLDVSAQERVLREADAVARILRRFENGTWTMIESRVLAAEIAARPDDRSRTASFARLTLVSHWTPVGTATVMRGEELENMGFRLFDALHIACAEQGQADVFLTTDDRLSKRARRIAVALRVSVANPGEWMEGVESNEENRKIAGGD
jgi:predicted nucleic acid-binding protein